MPSREPPNGVINTAVHVVYCLTSKSPAPRYLSASSPGYFLFFMGPIDQAIERRSAQTIDRPFDGLVGSREANRIILFILLTLVLISGECIVQGGEYIAAKGRFCCGHRRSKHRPFHVSASQPFLRSKAQVEMAKSSLKTTPSL